MYHAIPCLVAALLMMMPVARGAAVPAIPAEATSDTTLPTDAELESAGARIGRITIESREIFDLDDPREDKWLYRLANRLHIRTRASAIRAQLLFREGQPYRRELLDESERNLRSLDFLREPQIRPLSYHDGVVDVRIVTHDVWTLQVGPSYGRSGGATRSTFAIQDNNLLGFGKTLAVGAGRDVDRTSTYLEWRDPNVLGSRWRNTARFANSSDGHARSIAVWHPFYSLETHWTGGAALAQNRWSNSRYRLGERYDQYDARTRSADLYLGWSPGLQGDITRRFTAGLRQDDSRFATDATGATLGLLPADRILRYPYLRFDLVTNAFHKVTDFDQIARTEDQQLGLSAMLLTGWASRSLGADRNALIFDTAFRYGLAIADDHIIIAALKTSGRMEHGSAMDLRLRSEASWYWRTSPHTLLMVHVAQDTSRRPDVDHYLELGGDNGLRGFPLRYQQGTRRTMAKIEERLYTSWSLWRLFDVGGAAFFDIGRTTGPNPIGAPQLGWLKDAGIGLRLGNNRSSLGSVIHIDLATPIGAAPGISRLQLLIGTEATF